MSKPILRSFGQKFTGFFDNKSEGFERFHNDDFIRDTSKATETTELSSFHNGKCVQLGNGKHTKSKSEGDGWPDGGYTGILEAEEDDAGQKKDRDRISAWQAGWNVTNAIQVIMLQQHTVL